MCGLPPEKEIIIRKVVVELLSSGKRKRNWERRRERSLNRTSWKNCKKGLPFFSQAN
jgi:hypothetical protein